MNYEEKDVTVARRSIVVQREIENSRSRALYHVVTGLGSDRSMGRKALRLFPFVQEILGTGDCLFSHHFGMMYFLVVTSKSKLNRSHKRIALLLWINWVRIALEVSKDLCGAEDSNPRSLTYLSYLKIMPRILPGFAIQTAKKRYGLVKFFYVFPPGCSTTSVVAVQDKCRSPTPGGWISWPTLPSLTKWPTAWSLGPFTSFFFRGWESYEIRISLSCFCCKGFCSRRGSIWIRFIFVVQECLVLLYSDRNCWCPPSWSTWGRDHPGSPCLSGEKRLAADGWLVFVDVCLNNMFLFGGMAYLVGV